jgi:hypothetical protein
VTMKPRVKPRGAIWLALLWVAALFSCAAAADSLTVLVDRDHISLNETVNLTVRYDGRQVNSDPDFSGLGQFDVLSNHKSTQHSILNGNISAATEWQITLAPRNTGQLLIPPLSLQGQHSKALTITVTEPSKDAGGREDVFLETFVDKSSVHVQEQFIITYRLHFNQSVDSLDTGQININQTRVVELPRVDYQKNLGQTPYGVAEFRYAVFPDASGTVQVPAQTWTVRTTDQPGMNRFGFGGGRFKLHRVRTKELNITVNPKPDIYPAQKPWLPAQNLQITEQWSRAPDEFRVGEPITRTVTVTAEGVGPEQLPPLFDERGTADLKFYPDKPEQDKQLTAQGVTGTRTESVAIVPNRAGDLQLPELSVTWWNSAEKRIETAVLPARTLRVAASDAQALETPAAESVVPKAISQPAAAGPAAESSAVWWPLLVLLLVCGNAVTLLLWWRTSRQGQANPRHETTRSDPSLNNALRQLDLACQNRDATATRSALLHWARLRWPGRQATLWDIGRWSGDTAFAQTLTKLDALLFADSQETVDFAALAQAARRCGSTVGAASRSSLPPLYKAG